MSTQSVSIDLDSRLIDRLDRLARVEQRGRDQLLAEALEAFATSEERAVAAIEEGVAAADRGEFAADDEVRARFARWGVDVDGEG
ncbi:CopG family ribbon-helix-helix protein [Endothiovibrio diazotrophicus]